jgi:hypothetical protein
MRYNINHIFLIPKGTPVDVYLGADNEDPYLELVDFDPACGIEALIAGAEVLFYLRKFRMFGSTQYWDVDVHPFVASDFSPGETIIELSLREDNCVQVVAHDQQRAQTIEVTFSQKLFTDEEFELVMPPLADLCNYDSVDPKDSVEKFRSWYRGIGDLRALRVVAAPAPMRPGPRDINTQEGAAVFQALTASAE